MIGDASGAAPGVLGKPVAAGVTVATPLGDPTGMVLEAATGWAAGAETGDSEGDVTGESIGDVATGPPTGVGTEERDGESVVPVTTVDLTGDPAGTAAGEAGGADGFGDETGEASGVAPIGVTGACAGVGVVIGEAVAGVGTGTATGKFNGAAVTGEVAGAEGAASVGCATTGALTRSSVGGEETGSSTGVPAAGRIVTGASTGVDAGVAAVGDCDATGRPTTGADVVMFTIGIPVGESTGAGAAIGLLLITGVDNVAFTGEATGVGAVPGSAGGAESGGCRTEAIGETAIGGLSKPRSRSSPITIAFAPLFMFLTPLAPSTVRHLVAEQGIDVVVVGGGSRAVVVSSFASTIQTKGLILFSVLGLVGRMPVFQMLRSLYREGGWSSSSTENRFDLAQCRYDLHQRWWCRSRIIMIVVRRR
jgi:hypothetical protein